MSEDLKFLLEMYCQGSIYMTVQWVFGRVKRTPEELAADLVKAMPEELAGVFEGLDLSIIRSRYIFIILVTSFWG